MKKILLAIILAIFAVTPALASQITVEDKVVSEGETTNVNLTLDSVPDGLSGYNITISLSSPGVAEIKSVNYPTWAALNDNSSFPADSVWLKAVDLNEEVQDGATNVKLATLTLSGESSGVTELNVTVNKLDDDNGDPIAPSTVEGTLTVSGNNTSPGDNVEVTTDSTTVTFEKVNDEGQTTATSQTGNPAGGPPSGFMFRGYFVDVTTTATYSGNIEVCVDYTGVISGDESNLKLMHWDGSWDDVTTSLDTTNNMICGQVNSLSPFGIASTSSEPVGGEVAPVDKIGMLMPYIVGTVLTLIGGVGIYTARKQMK